MLAASVSAFADERQADSTDLDNPAIAKDGPSQKTVKHARAAYLGDQSTPGGIVYRSFLSNLTYFSTLSREDAVHRLVDTFKLPHDESGTALASSLYDHFEAAHDELESEVHAMQLRTICPPARASWTQDEVYSAFHKADDNVERISDKHLRRAQRQLTDEEFEKLSDHISELKRHFAYVKTDYASKYAELPVDVRDDLIQICARLGA